MAREIGGVLVHGISLDDRSRCAHWHGPTDIVAIRMKCCGRWVACIDCHRAIADHEPAQWGGNERGEHALLCGECGKTVSIEDYLGGSDQCPACGADFNPGCACHHHLYFQI